MLSGRRGVVLTAFERILPVSEDLMVRWRVLVEDGRRQGHTYSQPDLIIAATALHHGLCIVTRNVGDYAKTQVAVVYPWLERPCMRRAPAVQMTYAGANCNTSLPKFSPLNSFSKVAGKSATLPWTTSSLLVIRPALRWPASSPIASGKRSV